MKAHWLRHVPFEDPGRIAGWLDAAGFETSYTRLDAGDPLPPPDAMDLLIVMGGPMSVNAEHLHPWLAAEKRMIRQRIETDRPVLGICLGAQLMASAMGADVRPNRHREIGWFPIHGTTPADRVVFAFPPSLMAFHWHGETFDLPDGAIRIARSEGCENQAIQLGRSAVGLQFHLETTPESAARLVNHCRAEMSPGPFVQSEADILNAPAETWTAIHRTMGDLLEYLTDVRADRTA